MEEAKARIKLTDNLTGVQRDLKVLEPGFRAFQLNQPLKKFPSAGLCNRICARPIYSRLR